VERAGNLPVFASITEGKVHEVNIAKGLSLPKRSILVIDKGYVDYELFSKWIREGVYFVTRQKGNAKYDVIEGRGVPVNRNILKDQIIKFTGYYSKKKCPYQLRRIEVWDKDNERSIVLLTNHFEFGSTTIAAIYKDRWQIEIFFKTIKQNLKIKTFVGMSPNTLMIQIWTALISILVLKYLNSKVPLAGHCRISWLC